MRVNSMVLSGWFSLFCSGQCTGDRLRLWLEGLVGGKDEGLPERIDYKWRPLCKGSCRWEVWPVAVVHPEGCFQDFWRAPPSHHTGRGAPAQSCNQSKSAPQLYINNNFYLVGLL